jgi:hypothetical protein
MKSIAILPISNYRWANWEWTSCKAKEKADSLIVMNLMYIIIYYDPSSKIYF